MKAQTEFDVFLKGAVLDLVAVDASLVETTNWYRWFNDEELMRYTYYHRFPNTRRRQQEYFQAQITHSDTRLQLGIVHRSDRVLIGMASLNDIDFLNGTCQISGLIGERKYQNARYITEVFRMMLRHAFYGMNMHKVWGGAMRREIATLFCRTCGFKQEGIKRQEIFKDGKYHDLHLIGVLKEEFDVINRRSERSEPENGRPG